MSFTYDLASTSTGYDRSWVRLRIGDNSSGSHQLEDEEIDALLDTEGNRFLAAAVAAESLAGQQATKADKQVGRLRISYGQRAKSYSDLAKRLRFEAGLRGGVYAGGISRDDKRSDETDTDRVGPFFTRGQFDYPGTDPTGSVST